MWTMVPGVTAGAVVAVVVSALLGGMSGPAGPAPAPVRLAAEATTAPGDVEPPLTPGEQARLAGMSPTEREQYLLARKVEKSIVDTLMRQFDFTRRGIQEQASADAR